MNSSKRTILIIAIPAVVVIALIVIALIVGTRKHATPQSGTEPRVQFPSAGTSSSNNGTQNTPTLSIHGYSQETIIVNDFKKEAGVITDPNVPGQYDLVGGAYPDPGIPYSIFYQAKDDYFGITLLSEPLAKNRAAAERQLMQMLGLTQQDMCRLDYVVAPGPGVNDTYAGQNLGFSFCPGAVKLPY